MDFKNDLDELRFSVKYPFTSVAKGLVRRMNIDLKSNDPEIVEVIDTAKKRIKEDLRGGVILDPRQKLTRALEIQLLSYPVARILVALSRNNFMKKRFAEGESNTMRKFLMGAPDEEVAYLLPELGIKAEGGSIHFKDYIMFMPDDEQYRLFYQSISSGYVSINRDLIVEIMTSAYRRHILDTLSNYPSDFEFLKKELPDIQIKRFERFEYTGKANADAFPPCMKNLLAEAAAGEHLGHSARFAIAAFLVNVGYPIDKIVDVFKNQPNFKEKLTRYHVEYIAGKKDGKKRLPPSCEKMKTYALCVNPDALCSRVKNPLSYYKVKMRNKRGRG